MVTSSPVSNRIINCPYNRLLLSAFSAIALECCLDKLGDLPLIIPPFLATKADFIIFASSNTEAFNLSTASVYLVLSALVNGLILLTSKTLPSYSLNSGI